MTPFVSLATPRTLATGKLFHFQRAGECCFGSLAELGRFAFHWVLMFLTLRDVSAPRGTRAVHAEEWAVSLGCGPEPGANGWPQTQPAGPGPQKMMEKGGQVRRRIRVSRLLPVGKWVSGRFPEGAAVDLHRALSLYPGLWGRR